MLRFPLMTEEQIQEKAYTESLSVPVTESDIHSNADDVTKELYFNEDPVEKHEDIDAEIEEMMSFF